MLSHHGLKIGRRHARKHLAWALDCAAATAGASIELLRDHRVRVLTAEEPAQARRLLAEAGFPGGKNFPSVPVQVLNDESQPQVFEAIQAAWIDEV